MRGLGPVPQADAHAMNNWTTLAFWLSALVLMVLCGYIVAHVVG
jgi:hypothetical protein